MSTRESPPVLCVVGPTASGKTEIGISLAKRTNGEVICCDAFTVYRGMPILTAAPGELEGGFRHHLTQAVDPSETYSAARFHDDADRLVSEIRARSRTPIVVGGTALYLRGWIHGFGAPVPRDEAYRDELRQRAETEGPGALHAALAAVDPVRAAQLHPNDLRRIIRALEIARATGRPASEQRGQWEGPPRFAASVVCLVRSKEDLEERIERRTAQMFDDGVVAEAEALLQRELSPEAKKVLGLSDLEALLAGEIDEAEARARIAQKTRQLAKKQMTFFKGFPNVSFMDAEVRRRD